MSYSTPVKKNTGSYENKGNVGAYDTPSSTPKQNQQQSQPQAQAPTVNQTPIPKTIFVDCNRANSTLTEGGMNPSTNHSWTCEFPPIQIKTGDEIKVSSAYLNSIGVGDLINWTQDGEDKDNEASWLIEYYVSNDAKNDKREGYNLGLGKGHFPYPIDNKPARLYRYNNAVSNNAPAGSTRTNSALDYTWNEDPYIGGRFHGLVVDIPAVVVDNSFKISWITNVVSVSTSKQVQKVMLMKVQQFTNAAGADPTEQLQTVNAEDLFGAGQCFTVTGHSEPKASNANRATLNHNRFDNKYMCYGVFRNYNNTGENYVMVEAPAGWVWGADSTTLGEASLEATCKFTVTQGNGYMVANTVNTQANRNMRACNYNKIEQLISNPNYNNVDKSWFLYYGFTPTQETKTGNDNLNTSTNFSHATHQRLTDDRNGDTVQRIKCDILEDQVEDYKLYFDIVSLEDGANLDKNITLKFTTHKGVPVTIQTLDALYALNGNTWNVTMILNNPSEVAGVEVAVCYTGHNRPFSAAAGNTNATKVAGQDNTFLFTNTIRDLRFVQDLYKDDGHNTTVVNGGDNNYIILNGFDFTQKVRIQEDGRSYMSSTYANNKRGGPVFSELPLFYLVQANADKGVSDSQMESNDNSSITFGGFQNGQATDQGLDTIIGQAMIETSNVAPFTTTNPQFTPRPSRIVGIPTEAIMGTGNSAAEVVAINTLESVHYDFFKFSINENYSSPSDIATNLTKQTHTLSNARINYGTEATMGQIILDSKGVGIPQNKFIIPVYSSFDDVNTEPGATGQKFMNGLQRTGSYVCKKNMFNLPTGRESAGVLANGEYKIYFRTKFTSVNKPFLTPAQATQALPVTGNEDFNCNDVTGGEGGGPFTAATKDETGAVVGYPIEYLKNQSAYIAQYAGANNVTFGWDDTQSRFTLGYLGQQSVSDFSVEAGSGGDPAITVYYPSPSGQDNYNFLRSRTRDSGVNIVNWYSRTAGKTNLTPAQIKSTYNIAAKYTLDAYFDEGSANSFGQEWFLDTTYNKDTVGTRFWNKLGFTPDQTETELVGHDIGLTDGNYYPKGSTELELDSADGILTSDDPAENTPFYTTSGSFGPPPATGDPVPIEAHWEYASRGGLELGNHNVGMGVPSTAGRPTEFRRNIVTDGTDKTKFNVLDSSYNPDRQEFNGYTLKTEPEFITAKKLPIKTEYGYYYMLSDLVDSDFFISKDYGSQENIIGVLSKLNVGGDYIFQYQAPQTFYAKRDAIVTSIKTTILTPKLQIPPALDEFSSVIYQITRYEPQPEPTARVPVWYQQEQKFSQIMNFINSLAHQVNPPKQTQAQRIQEIIGEVANAVTTAGDQQAVITDRILSNYQQLGLSRFKNDRAGMRQYLLENPEAQNFLNDLSVYQHSQNNAPPQQISDPESVNPDSLINSILTQQPTRGPNFIGIQTDDQQVLADHIDDTIENYTGDVNNAPIEQLVDETYNLNPVYQRQMSDEFEEDFDEDPELNALPHAARRLVRTQGRPRADDSRRRKEKVEQANFLRLEENKKDDEYIRKQVAEGKPHPYAGNATELKGYHARESMRERAETRTSTRPTPRDVKTATTTPAQRVEQKKKIYLLPKKEGATKEEGKEEDK